MDRLCGRKCGIMKLINIICNIADINLFILSSNIEEYKKHIDNQPVNYIINRVR